MQNNQASLTEREMWDQAIQKYQDYRFSLSPEFMQSYRNHPNVLTALLSRYKFAARLAARQGSTVLELQCGDGVGAAILGEQADSYVGVDADPAKIRVATSNFSDPRYRFLAEPFLGKNYGRFSLLVAFGLEHPAALTTVIDNLADSGVCILGLQQREDQQLFASCLKQYFSQVFSFGMSHEVVHTNLAACNYYLLLACLKKSNL